MGEGEREQLCETEKGCVYVRKSVCFKVMLHRV